MIPLVSAFVLAMALSVSRPAHAYLRAEHMETLPHNVVAYLWVDHHDSKQLCQALVNVFAYPDKIHGAPVAISIDRLVLYRNGVEVASIGKWHIDVTTKAILDVGTAIGPKGWYRDKPKETKRAFYQAKVSGIRVRFADHFLTDSEDVQSGIDHNLCAPIEEWGP
jgi:hypothetical protein